MSDREKKKSPLTMHEEFSKNNSGKPNGYDFPGLQAENTSSETYDVPEGEELTDEIDHQILMHRDAHFGGDFGVMLAYYQDENHIGIHPDFELERIHYLAQVEEQLGQDLAPFILTGPEAEQVGRARLAYEQLKNLYQSEETANSTLKLIADLILTEEEEPDEEIEAVVSQGTGIVPELLAILNADEAYNPLFPGYGFSPYLAILCLGKIGDPQAIIPIFETLSKQTLFDDLVVLEALAAIGVPARDFLLKVIKSRPITQDTLNAAFALTTFVNHPVVARACFQELQDAKIRENSLLRTYLLCNCETINRTPDKEAFIQMSQSTDLPLDFRSEIKKMIEEWK